jgi:drug/metabolite transporter (DMT)-like permease
MQTARKPMDGFGAGIMLLLCVVLGLHQVALKAAAPDIAPMLQIALRSGISAILICLVITWQREGFSLQDGTLKPGLLLGVVFSVEFFFVAEGLRFTSASHMSVFLYTAPIFTALALHRVLPSERLNSHQWFGIGISFLGIVMAFAGSLFHTDINMRMLWGDFLAILGGVAWAGTTIIIRTSRLANAPSTKTLLYQLAVAFVLLLTYAISSGQARKATFTHLAVGSVLFQAVVITFAVYLAWFSLLRRYHASQLSAFLFMTPLFGVSFGVLLLHEPIDIFFAIGAVMVLTGITLAGRPQPFRTRSGPAPNQS